MKKKPEKVFHSRVLSRALLPPSLSTTAPESPLEPVPLLLLLLVVRGVGHRRPGRQQEEGADVDPVLRDLARQPGRDVPEQAPHHGLLEGGEGVDDLAEADGDLAHGGWLVEKAARGALALFLFAFGRGGVGKERGG